MRPAARAGPPAVGPVGATGASTRTDRWFAVGFAVVAVLLAPWIVDLYLTQAYVGVSTGLVVTSVGILGALAVGLAVSAVACRGRSRWAVIPVSTSGTLAAATAFFHVATGTAASPTAAALSSVLVFVPIVVLSCWVAVRLHRSAGPPRRAWIAFAMAAVVMVPLVWRAAATSPASHAATHLRLTWTVLDVVELVAILALAITLWRGSAAVAAVATATAALLISDVWFNVLATTGDTQTSGLEMSAVSLPLAGVALGVAVRALRPGSPSRRTHARRSSSTDG